MNKISIITHSANYSWLIALVFTTHLIVAQPIIELSGRVVETANGVTKGVPKVKIVINNIDNDITASDGSFKVFLKSTNQKFVELTLTDMDNRQIVSPIDRVVNIPPSNNIEVLICSQQNHELISKVGALNKKIKALQEKYNLSKSLVQKLQKEMVDTVMFFEQKIQIIEAENDRRNIKSKSDLGQKDKRIAELEKELDKIQLQLVEAKDEYFLKKQMIFQSVSAALRRYLDAVQNLRVMLLPDRVSHYFINEEALKQLSRKIDAYNASRDILLGGQDGHINAVQHYWPMPSSAKRQLEATYAYILSDIHDKTVYPVEFSVLETIKKWTTGKLGRLEAQKKALQDAKEPFNRLTMMIPLLEDKIITTINELKQDF